MDNLIEIMTDMEKKVPSFLESLCKLLAACTENCIISLCRAHFGTASQW